MTDTPTTADKRIAGMLEQAAAAALSPASHKIISNEIAQAIADARYKAFNHGYLIAVANLINLHGDSVVANDVMSQETITMGEIQALDLNDYDLAVLRKLYFDYPTLGVK